jgi:hypothetical protein
MINYPTGSWETDLKIPGNFIRHYNEFVEQIFQSEDPIRNFKNERLYILWEYAKSVADLEGDFVECGVFHGMSAFFMAKECKTHLHLFDSLQGVTDFTEYDNEFYREMPWVTDINTLNKTMEQFDNYTLHVGEFPFEFDQVSKISLLHIDVDNYNPTKTALEGLWGKVVPGGVVIVDFHDSVATGAEKATRDFFEGHDILVMPTGKAIIVKN